ncbi:MAG: hypothetical protein U0610_28790 [bacterium]
MTPPASNQRQRVTRYALLFTLVLASGFHHLFGRAGSPFFRLDLVVHPLLGLLATGTIIVTLFHRVREEVPAFGWIHLAGFVLMAFVALVRSFTMAHLPEQRSNMLTAVLSPLLVVCTAHFFLRTVPLMAAFSRARRGWAHLTLLSLWLLATLVGVLIASNAFTGRVPSWIRAFHAALGYAAAGAGAWVLLRPAWRRLRESGLGLGVTSGLVIFALAAAITNALGARVEQLPKLAPVTLHLSVVPNRLRAADDRDDLPFPVDASWLEISESCLGAGCHADLEDGFRHSSHNVSYRTPHMHAILDLLAAEEGVAEQAICAGCHIPGSLFRGGPPPAAYRTRTNLPCVFCHSITSTTIEDHDRSRLTLGLDATALAPFRAAETAGRPLTAADRTAIQLNTRAHGRVFARPLLAEDAFCLACHHNPLVPADARSPVIEAAPAPEKTSSLPGFTAPPERERELRCVDCHLPPSRVLDPGGTPRNHLFPGANTTVLRLLGFEEDAAFTERWMQSRFLARTLEDLYGRRDVVRRGGDERKAAFFYAEMRASFVAQPSAGSDAVLRIETRNLGMGHPFPASSLGLGEAWLEVRVTDASGREVFASGGLDESQRVLAGSHTLGGRLLDRDGTTIDRYRVWAAAHEIVDRQIPHRGSVTDEFAFAVPEGAQRHLNIAAVWHYRKLGQPFWDWAYPNQRPIPSSEVVRTFTQFPLAPPR